VFLLGNPGSVLRSSLVRFVRHDVFLLYESFANGEKFGDDQHDHQESHRARG
jgi:hypothetical protein